MEGHIVVSILAAVFVVHLMRKWVLYVQSKHTKSMTTARDSPITNMVHATEISLFDILFLLYAVDLYLEDDDIRLPLRYHQNIISNFVLKVFGFIKAALGEKVANAQYVETIHLSF